MPDQPVDIPAELQERYSDFRFLGAGAVGRVYKATDKVLLVDVAIKILARNQSSETVVRFQREAKAASKLAHRNLVSIMNVGIAGGDQLYLVMEYAKGRTLSDLLKDKPLSLAESVNIVSQICEGMSHAHSSGVTHRDLKPSNVLVDSENLTDASVKVVDFGIAKIDNSTGSAGGVTISGEIIGTPQYMSPEQITSEPVDRRSDIYSTGCILYFMLTARHPHEADSMLELMQAKTQVTAPRVNSVGNHRPVPEEVEDVVARCLMVNPDDRFSTMGELKEALLKASHVSDIGEVKSESSKRLSIGIYALLAASLSTVLFGSMYMLLVNQSSEHTDKKPVPLASSPSLAAFDNHEIFVDSNDISLVFRRYKKDPDAWSAVVGATDDHLALLVGQRVRELKLSGQPKFTDRACHHIAKLNDLAVLNLSDTEIGNAGVAELAKCRNLRELSLSGTKVDDNGLEPLTRLPLLDNLSLEHTRVTNDGMKFVAKMKSLGRIDLTRDDISDAGLMQLSKIPLFCVHLEQTKVSNHGLSAFAKSKTLDRLYVEGTAISEAGLRNVGKCRLSEIWVDGCSNVDDRCLEYIARTWPNILKLGLADTKVTAAGIKSIEKLHHLTELRLSALHLSDADLEPIFGLQELQTLNLRGNEITDKTIGRIPELSRLKKLELTHCPHVSDRAVNDLKTLLRTRKRYMSITAPSVDLDAEGAVDFSELLQN